VLKTDKRRRVRMKKVYMVDDDVDMVTAITTSLESKGYEVKSQYDDKGLVDNIREFDPDAIILDVMFPDDNGAGFKMARAIRHHDDIKNKPVIMLSSVNKDGKYPGEFSSDDIDDMYLPITEFVNKPIDPKDLIATIEKLTA
jgi:DNA-binding response OmpR family regulator